jgi:pyruvate/2-oxoglutarate dehydrogenase complex dihydrolipoamide dehydrogenase (E3) component
VVERERTIVRTNIERHNVEIFQGVARLEDAHTVSFVKPDGTEGDVTGDIILIATGSSPFRPAGILWHRLFGGPASENGRFRHGDGTRADRTPAAGEC